MPSFCLSGKGLQNINWDLLADDFTFVIDEPFATFSTNKLLADFISPNVASIHLTEATISEYHIEKGDPEIFNQILNLLKGEKVEFDFQSLSKVFQIAKSIGNQEIICFVDNQLNEPLSINNITDRIINQAKNHRYIEQKLIDFAATNLCEIPKNKLFQLDVDMLSMILSDQHLSIFSEDYLFDLVCDLFTFNQDNADLFQYIIFNNLKDESISKFTLLVPFEFISPSIWSSLSTIFFKTNSNNSRQIDRSSIGFKQERYKALFFDYNDMNEIKNSNESQNEENQKKSDEFSINQSNYQFLDFTDFIKNNQLNETQQSDSISTQGEIKDEDVIPIYTNSEDKNEQPTQNKFNGIINYLSNKYDGNVNKLNIIEITSSGVNKNHPLRNVDWLVEYDDKTHYFQSNNEPNAWICFDFKNMSVSPTKYALKSRPDFGSGSDHLKSWVVEGSNDKSRWTILDEREGADMLNGAGSESIFRMNMKLEKSKYFRYLRIRATGPMCSGYYNMTVAHVEFYGFLVGC